MSNSGPPVRILVAGSLPEQLTRDTIVELNETALFCASLGGPIDPSGLRELGVLHLEEAVSLLMRLRRREYIPLVLTQMPVLDKYDRRTFGLAVEADVGLLGAGMVSTSRLIDDADNQDVTGTLAKERLAKESLHELGHALGLRHCRTSFCAMRRSLEPSDVDARSLRFCAKCLLDIELRVRKPLH